MRLNAMVRSVSPPLLLVQEYGTMPDWSVFFELPFLSYPHPLVSSSLLHLAPPSSLPLLRSAQCFLARSSSVACWDCELVNPC